MDNIINYTHICIYIWSRIDKILLNLITWLTGELNMQVHTSLVCVTIRLLFHYTIYMYIRIW